MKLHTMIDLETISTATDAAILQIGAVTFDPYSDYIGEKFSIYLKELNGDVNVNTLAWWLGQSEEARNKLKAGLEGQGSYLGKAIDELRQFIDDQRASNGVWSHGATFDIPILRSAAGRVGRQMNWKFWNEYDTRTLYLVKGRPQLTREGVYHDALDDAIYQAKCVQEVMAR